ncbi:APHP domain-containing protein [Methanofervidicoccus sp. A16]|uniref:CARDB domain-containing protein n=1 Tax=Methanofervidicoccus sp. A16 TaxID=2607662 RepID=UPI00118CC1BA|nr:CARDB domain-containing protein [Methanofervidicoccus sp. A16]AXI25383.1 APHP domain-containing protein [Methanofervidicoccus sp. A16]
MKWKFLIAILLMSLIGICYGEDITVELVPSNVEVEVGNIFNLTLVVKNVPEDGKCGGFETEISYDSNVVNLTDIKLSEVGENASLKEVNLSSGKISLIWFSESPYGNFTLAVLSFKTLKPGEINITLKKTVIANDSGHSYNKDKIIIHPATVTVKGPNLNITNISIDTPYYRINTPINVTITNNGHLNNSRSFSVDLYADANKIGSITVNGLKIGESKTLTFNWTPEKIKPYTIVAVVDVGNVVPEENEDDNKIVKVVKVTEKPIYIKINPSNLTTDLDDTFTVNISLYGVDYRRPVKGIEGVLTYDPQVLTCTNFTFLVNATQDLKNITFERGKVIFKIIDGEINTSSIIATAIFKVIGVSTISISFEEVNISDVDGYLFKNITINPATVTIRGPNLNITNISIDTPYYRINTPINVTITNNGHLNNSRSFSVDLYADANKIGSITVNGLKIGESKTLTFNWTPEKIKPYTIVAVVDVGNVVPEENEDDNKIVKVVKVTEKPIYIKINPSNLTTDLDDTFTVNISLYGVDYRRPVKGIEGVLTYDPQVLTCTNFTFLVNATQDLKNITFERGKVIFKIIDGEINTSSIIATAIFKVIGVSTISISFEEVNISDVDGYLFKNITINPATVTIRGPNLNITNISIDTPYYRINTPINVTITNNGHLNNSRSFSVDLYADANKIGSITVNGLKIGESKTLTFNWTPEKIKPYTIVAVVDVGNVVPEENEDDNKIVKVVEVRPVTTYVKLYKISQDNNTIWATLDVLNIPEKRPVGGYDIYIKLENLSVINVTSIGISNWSLSNNILFITGYNFSKSGNFSITNITFNVTDTTYSIILHKIILSDIGGYPFKRVAIDIKNIKISENIKDIYPVELIITEDINITKLKAENLNDTLLIPILNESTNIIINESIIENITKILEVANNITNKTIKNESDVEEVVEKIKENITPVLAQNFKINNKTVNTTKVGNKVISTISFKAENTSKKGFITVRIPIGNLTVEKVTVFDGTTTVTLVENDIGNKIGWYRIPVKGVLEITLIKDPVVKVTLSAKLPPKKTTIKRSTDERDTPYTSSGGGPSPLTKIVARDIKSENIMYFVYKTKLIVGSEIDINLSAKYLKTDVNITDRSLEIKEDCILIGGPVANPVVKKYLNYFPVRVTNEYPGKHRGVIEVIKIDGHTVVLLAGSDRWGTKAAVEYFKTLEDLPDEPIFVEWRNGEAVRIERS